MMGIHQVTMLWLTLAAPMSRCNDVFPPPWAAEKNHPIASISGDGVGLLLALPIATYIM